MHPYTHLLELGHSVIARDPNIKFISWIGLIGYFSTVICHPQAPSMDGFNSPTFKSFSLAEMTLTQLEFLVFMSNSRNQESREPGSISGLKENHTLRNPDVMTQIKLIQ